MPALLLRVADLLPSVLHPKVATSGLAGALSTLVLWLLTLVGVSVPDPVSAAIVVLVSFLIGYLTPSGPRAVTTPTPAGGSITTGG